MPQRIDGESAEHERHPAPDERSAADKQWDALVALNTDRERVDGAATGRRIAFDVALLHCELRFGAQFIYAPGRWDTEDGCVPVRVVWAYFAALTMGHALDALTTARGIGLAFGSEEAGERARTAAVDEAYPPSE